jgi:hypothetical protein
MYLVFGVLFIAFIAWLTTGSGFQTLNIAPPRAQAPRLHRV